MTVRKKRVKAVTVGAIVHVTIGDGRCVPAYVIGTNEDKSINVATLPVPAMAAINLAVEYDSGYAQSTWHYANPRRRQCQGRA